MQEGDLRIAILARIKEMQANANAAAEANWPDEFARLNDRALELRDVYDQLMRTKV
jgi:hypothetical protein